MISNEEQHNNLTLVTVSDIGSNHRVLCIPNQDESGFYCNDDDFALAVSDGVGSCKKAKSGAKYVVEVITTIFLDVKSGALPFDNLKIAEEIIIRWKNLIGNNLIDDYCATIKAVIKIGNIAKIISLGDGLAVITSNGFSLVSPTEETAFTNETDCMSSFVSYENIWIRDFYLDTCMPYSVFCCTDGVANSLVYGKEIELVNEIEQKICSKDLKLEIENLITEISDYSFDDKTVGVVKYEWKN